MVLHSFVNYELKSNLKLAFANALAFYSIYYQSQESLDSLLFSLVTRSHCTTAWLCCKIWICFPTSLHPYMCIVIHPAIRVVVPPNPLEHQMFEDELRTWEWVRPICVLPASHLSEEGPPAFFASDLAKCAEVRRISSRRQCGNRRRWAWHLSIIIEKCSVPEVSIAMSSFH